MRRQKVEDCKELAHKAWQRQITPNAAYSTKKLLEELEQIFTENEK